MKNWENPRFLSTPQPPPARVESIVTFENGTRLDFYIVQHTMWVHDGGESPTDSNPIRIYHYKLLFL